MAKAQREADSGHSIGQVCSRRTQERLREREEGWLEVPERDVIAKSIAQPGDKPALPSQVAVVRKVNGRWKFVEYSHSGSRYTVLAQGQFCLSCHVTAKSNDFVFTKR